MPPRRSSARPGVRLRRYLAGSSIEPCFARGDALEVLRQLPDGSVDCCMTSPPYWGHRVYTDGGLGGESTPERYVAALTEICAELHRVLRREGSVWLNIGDSYRDKGLQNIPWRVATRLTDDQGWVLRNTVVWHKVKGGPDNSRDKLRGVWEPLFHFVKQRRGYYYDTDAVRRPPRAARVVSGRVVSATGVSGVRYERQIALSTTLSPREKEQALAGLRATLEEVQDGRLSDFRMVIRGRQRTTHSDARAVSGRARELAERGFYFLRYHPKGSKLGDVWDILPEDTQGRGAHFAAYPEELCITPLLATCPAEGVVLDPFCGTGTTNRVAMQLGRRSIGIDRSAQYLAIARRRCRDVD